MMEDEDVFEAVDENGQRNKPDKGRRHTRQLPSSPGQRLSMEFQKCEAMYESLQMRRSDTTLGFGLEYKDDKVLDPIDLRLKRHQQAAAELPPPTSPRLNTAPGVLGSATSGTNGVRRQPTAKSENPTSTTQTSPKCDPDIEERITPDDLIRILKERGLGTPTWYRHPPAPPEAAIANNKHYSNYRKIGDYMDKIKGRSRMDCDIASAKAMAFCDEQRQEMRAQNRSVSAVFRSRLPESYRQEETDGSRDGKSVTESQNDVNTDKGNKTSGSANKEKIGYNRIQTWIEDCEQATISTDVNQQQDASYSTQKAVAAKS